MNIIDQSVFSQSKVENFPFGWGVQKNLIQEEMQVLLANQFPTEHFVPASRLEGPGKHYRFEVLSLIEKDRVKDSFFQLPTIWKNFIEELSSPTYIQSLANHLSMRFDEFTVDIGLFRFNTNDWVEVHTDRVDKIVTQLFYFNTHWEDHWGGELYILAEPTLSSVLCKVAPTINRSAHIVRSDDAWHYVAPVTESAKFPRLSLQVEIIKK